MKNTLSFFAFLFFSSALFSQNISFGINGGLCIAEQTFFPPPNTTLDPVDTAPKFGLSTGGYIVFHLHKNIAIRSGFYFEQKGERYKDVQFTDINGNPTDEGTIKKNVNYWQVPILMEFSGGKTINWFVNGGYAYGRLTKAELKYHRAIIDNQRTFDIKYTYLDDDHSIVFGGGLRVPISTSLSVNLEARSYIGQRNTLDKINNPSLADVEEKNRSISLMTGIIYTFRKK